MRRRSVIVGMVVCTAAATGVTYKARGGSKGAATDEVFVSPSQSLAEGSLGRARNSTDNNQYIGCDTYNDSSGGITGQCKGSNASGTSFYCLTSDPVLTKIIESMASDSYVFVMWDGQNCTNIGVYTYSYYSPKVL